MRSDVNIINDISLKLERNFKMCQISDTGRVRARGTSDYGPKIAGVAEDIAFLFHLFFLLCIQIHINMAFPVSLHKRMLNKLFGKLLHFITHQLCCLLSVHTVKGLLITNA